MPRVQQPASYRNLVAELANEQIIRSGQGILQIGDLVLEPVVHWFLVFRCADL